ncbi:Carotenoid oxygenase [Penicillium taxi]|uniref:Carotenoid oxygenase n=1 Tax=Penicillium taxi TaxID=168475 RepID=UPI002544D9B0|nr:Carotenoid oxygenase [Penicillium taxi]KAJ5899480.1 Carotenoid oxygenase [Penicillium taxi]
MSSLESNSPLAEPSSSKSDEPWNNWPNDKGFDPEYEQREPVELSVTGHIPAYAAGVLYRTGPGKSQVETEDGQLFQLTHWFDGFTQTHRFQIISTDTQTRVVYNSRFSTDAAIDFVRKTGRFGRFGFGQEADPCKSVYSQFQSEFSSATPPHSDVNYPNIGVTLSINMPGLDPHPEGQDRWNGIQNLYAKTDYNAFKKLDPETLEPIGLAQQGDLHPDLTGPISASHARSDPITGDVFNFNLSVGKTSTYRVFHVSASTGKTTILATFSGVPAYIHSLFITEDYVLLCVWNSHVDITKSGKMSVTYSILPPDASEPATWYVVDRKNGQGLVATYESEAFFCFHTINSWQEPSKEDPKNFDIVADLVRYDNSDFIHALLYERLKSSLPSAKEFAANRDAESRSTITRFRLPDMSTTPTSEIKKATIEWSAAKSLSPELPVMSTKFVTRQYRYLYSTTWRGESTLTDGIMKFDCDKLESSLWACHGHSPGEPIFVANPDGVSEDDGVLLSVVLDGVEGTSYLLCLDAQTMAEVGRANVNGAVGFGFHGQHVPIVGLPTGDY